jgi:hypothetical protein
VLPHRSLPLISPRPLHFVAAAAAALLAVAWSSAAIADPVAVAPAPDFAGHGSGPALEKAVAHALQKAGVATVSAALAAGRARAAKVPWNPKLNAKSAGALAQSNHWAGVVLFAGNKHKITARLVDTGGEPVVTQSLAIVKKHVPPAHIEALAKGIAALLAASQSNAPPPAAAPPPPAAAAPPPPEGGVTEATPEAAAPAPAPAEPPPAAESQETRLLRWDVELGGFAGERKFYVPGGFSYRTAFPYGGPALGASVFPFGEDGSWVQGFGLIGMGQLGIVQAEFSGTTTTFTSTDILGELDLAYQFALAGDYGTRFTFQAGAGLRYFDAPASSSLSDDDRFYPDVGVQIEQPILPHYLRLTAGAAYLPVASQGGAAQTAFGKSSGWGFDWTAGLAGRILGALGWEAQFLQQRFSDSYTGVSTGGAEIDTSYRLLLTLQH